MTWFLNYTSPNPVLSITWDISGTSTSLENYVKIFCKDVSCLSNTGVVAIRAVDTQMSRTTMDETSVHKGTLQVIQEASNDYQV